MVTPAQIRAARAALGWSAADLAKAAGLSLRTIQAIETNLGLEKARKSSVLALRVSLEDAGIEFTGTPDDAPGIRIHRVQGRTNR
jgi:DNA-binding XRE family transcriptional regulator